MLTFDTIHYLSFPHTELHINTAENKHISELVAQGKACIGFMLCDDALPQKVELGLVGYLPISMVANNNHPLHSQDSIHLNELKRYHQILLTNMHSPWNVHFASSVDMFEQ